MQKLLLVGLGLCTAGALWKAEEEEDGMALSPFLAAPNQFLAKLD